MVQLYVLSIFINYAHYQSFVCFICLTYISIKVTSTKYFFQIFLAMGSCGREDSLIDLSPEELANAAAIVAAHSESNTGCRRVVNILDEPIDVDRGAPVVVPQELWPENDPRMYANCPQSNGIAASDPFDTSRVFSNSPQSRYYSQVSPDMAPSCYYSPVPFQQLALVKKKTFLNELI